MRRLWPNYREVEADYYRRTGIFPIRHVVVVKDEVLQRDPEVAAHLVRVFEDAKQHAYHYWADHRRSYLAWFGAEQEEERALLGARSLAVLGAEESSCSGDLAGLRG